MIPYLLMFLAGLGIGYAAIGRWKWAVLVVPVILLLLALLTTGLDGVAILRFVIGALLTAAGVMCGIAIERRSEDAAVA